MCCSFVPVFVDVVVWRGYESTGTFDHNNYLVRLVCLGGVKGRLVECVYGGSMG